MAETQLILVPVKSYNLTELAGFYDCDEKTLKKWMEPFKEYIGKSDNSKVYTPIQVTRVFEKIGPCFTKNTVRN